MKGSVNLQTCSINFVPSFRGSDGKESVCNVGDPGSFSGSGRLPGEENGNPLQYFLSWRRRSLADYSPRGRKESDTTE